LARNQGVRYIPEGNLNGLRILKLRLLPEGHTLPLLCSEGSALIDGT
jgi:hypothetical protein